MGVFHLKLQQPGESVRFLLPVRDDAKQKISQEETVGETRGFGQFWVVSVPQHFQHDSAPVHGLLRMPSQF